MNKLTLGVLALGLAAGAPASAQDAPARPQAIEYSDAYYTRLSIHRVGSYAMLPLFAGEYLLGRELMSDGDVAGWVKGAHVGVATGIGLLFAVNTVTGAMNLWESRHEEEGRNRRLLHAALLTLADAGFLATAMLGEDADDSNPHRDVALVSIGVSTAGTLMMWLGGH